MRDEATLAEELRGMGWAPEPHGPGTVRCTHDSAEGPIQVYVRFDKNWVVASVVPFLATRGQNSFELSRWLLRQNRDMTQAKFAYDEDGDVTLTVELPTESLDDSELRAALDGLLAYTAKHRGILREAARAAGPTTPTA